MYFCNFFFPFAFSRIFLKQYAFCHVSYLFPLIISIRYYLQSFNFSIKIIWSPFKKGHPEPLCLTHGALGLRGAHFGKPCTRAQDLPEPIDEIPSKVLAFILSLICGDSVPNECSKKLALSISQDICRAVTRGQWKMKLMSSQKIVP